MRVSLVFALCLATAPAFADTLYVSEQGRGVAVIDSATGKLTARYDVGGKGPRGIAITGDGALLLTANKDSGDLSVLDRATGKLLRRVPVGPSAEMVRTHGNLAYVTYEPPGEKEGRAHIAIVDPAAGRVIASIPSGHETEGVEFSPDGKTLLVTNEGDDTVSLYALPGGAPIRQVKMPRPGMRPRGIKRLPAGAGYAVTLEFANELAILGPDFAVKRLITTKEAPYGVGPTPDGKHLLVAAAKADAVQVFDAKTLALQTEIPVGKRCWHFVTTADAATLAVACGRSGDLRLFTPTGTARATVKDLSLPWGVVAWPAGAGSLQ